MKTQTLTHIASVRLESLSLAEQTMHLLGWNWDQYTDHQFEQYCNFVDRLCHGWPLIRQEILYSPIFRGFWINEWNERTQCDWLPMALDNRDMEAYVMDEYLFLHSVARLYNDEAFSQGYHHALALIRKGGQAC